LQSLSAGDRVNGLAQADLGIARNLSDRGAITNQAKCSLGVHGFDGACIVTVVIDNDIARQEQADAKVRGQSAVRQRWIAGAKNYVRTEFDAQFVLQRLSHVNFGEYAETLLFERGPGALDRVLV
jgi:hypothetical protein